MSKKRHTPRGDHQELREAELALVQGPTAPLATGRQFPRLSSLAHLTIPCQALKR